MAGLLRSLDYAGLAALERLGLTLPDAVNAAYEAVAQWRHQAASAFMTAYAETLKDHPVWPGEAVMQQWLDFLRLDKVFYEIGYELANRPAWLHVPLIGLWRLLFDNEALPA
jgi:maltose alpha-D-glucosyltransferase/alpha-amylase